MGPGGDEQMHECAAQKPSGVVGAEEEMHELECMVAMLGGMTFAVILLGRHACTCYVRTWWL